MNNFRFRDLREDRDLTQKAVAEFLQIAERTYSGYESGTRSMPIQILIELSYFYKTSVDYILDITDDPRPYKRNKK